MLEDGQGKSYIENVATGKKIHFLDSGGIYVLDADCFTGAAVFSTRGSGSREKALGRIL